MKNITIATALALSSSLALAAPHDYQVQVGSSELDPSIWEGPELPVRAFKPDLRPTYYEQLSAALDPPFTRVGSIEPTGPTRISLYEMQRGSPEATAYGDYYEQFPADTDWGKVAQEFKQAQGDV